jgi:SAM-dependent methyltransferase
MTEGVSEVDKARAKAFTQLMVRHFEGASVVLMLELGRRVGLLDAMAGTGKATSEEIAGRAGLSERYVREWLGAMVCGGVVEYDAAGGTYRLPPEHAELVAGSGSKNLATMAAFFPLFSGVLGRVADAVRNGGGLPYSAFPEFAAIQEQRSRPRYDEFLLSRYLPAVDGLTARLESGLRVADIGCGTGYGLMLLAARFPASTFVGYDIWEPAVERAREEARARGLANVSFAAADAARVDGAASFDLVTAFDAIHDQVDPAAVLRRIHDALAPGGTFLMLEPWSSSNLEDNVGTPMAPYLYTISTFHCMSVSLAHGGAGLGTAWGRQVATRMLEEAGFAEVRVIERVDPANSLFVARRGG